MGTVVPGHFELFLKTNPLFEYHLHASNNVYICDGPVLCQQLGVSLDETVSERDLDDLLWVFGCESSAVRRLFLCTLSFAQ